MSAPVSMKDIFIEWKKQIKKTSLIWADVDDEDLPPLPSWML